MNNKIRWMMKMQSSSGLCSFDKWVLRYINENEIWNQDKLIDDATKSGYTTEVHELLRSLSESYEDS